MTATANLNLIPNDGKHTLALFDLDHTLINVDSDYMWGEYLVKHNLVEVQAYRDANLRFYQQYIAGTLDATEYNEFVSAFLTQHPLPTLQQWLEDYVTHDIVPTIRPQAQQAIAEHLQSGHEVVIISATNDFVVNRVAQCFGIASSHVLATPLEMSEGRYTGRLADKPNFKEGKLYHLDKWLAQQAQAGRQFSHTYAYSDSKNDLPLLLRADVPICVTPDDTLHAHALAHGWAVLDWSL